MASSSSSSSSHLQIYILIIISLISTLSKASNSNPFTIPITKDPSTLQYLATIRHGNPFSSSTLVLDLNARLTWTRCDSDRRIVPRGSIQCLAAKSGSINDKASRRCSVWAENEIGRSRGRGELVEEILAVDQSTVEILLGCTAKENSNLNGLTRKAQGVLGLGKAQISLPSQISAQKGFEKQFTTCFSSSNGVVLIEDGYLQNSPFFGSEISDSMVYTPLLRSTGRDYVINLKSVNIGGKKVSLGIETATLSSVVPYTTMESSIYAVFKEAYLKAALAMNMTQLGPNGPFGLCFESKHNGPEIEFVLQSELVKWKLSGRNSLVRISEGIDCLGFLDGGLGLGTNEGSIVLGGFELEDRVLHFDVGNSMLGFSSPLSKWQKSCSNFVNLDSTLVQTM